MIRILEFTGRPVILIIEEFGKVLLLFLSEVSWAIRPPFRFRVLFKQMKFVGVHFLTVVAITGTFTGVVLALQRYYGFRLFGGESPVTDIKSPLQAVGFHGVNCHRAFYPAAPLA